MKASSSAGAVRSQINWLIVIIYYNKYLQLPSSCLLIMVQYCRLLLSYICICGSCKPVLSDHLFMYLWYNPAGVMDVLVTQRKSCSGPSPVKGGTRWYKGSPKQCFPCCSSFTYSRLMLTQGEELTHNDCCSQSCNLTLIKIWCTLCPTPTSVVANFLKPKPNLSNFTEISWQHKV